MRAHARKLPSMMGPKKTELTAADEQHLSTHGDNTLQLPWRDKHFVAGADQGIKIPPAKQYS